MEKKIYTVIVVSEPQGAIVDAIAVNSFNSIERAEECRKEFFKKEIKTFKEVYGRNNVIFDENKYTIESTNWTDKERILIDENFLEED